MPKPLEVAEIIVQGQTLKTWETVWVHHQFPSTFREFRFTVSEKTSKSATDAAKQIAPGMMCQVRLAGELAVTGIVYERQTYADSKRHAVQICGQSLAGEMTRASSETKNNGSHDGKSLLQIAKDVAPPGTKIITKGNQKTLMEPIESAQLHPGEAPFQMLERLARGRNAFFGDDAEGNFILHGGGVEGVPQGGPALVEGKNIKWLRATITDLALRDPSTAYVQAAGTSKIWGRAVAQPKLSKNDPTLGRYRPNRFILGHPVGTNRIQKDLKNAVNYEMAWRASSAIRIDVGVYGWLKPDGGLWQASGIESVYVYSPMAMVTETLIIQQVTFVQDNAGGTMTILECVNRQAMFSGGPSYASNTGTGTGQPTAGDLLDKMPLDL